MGETSQTESSKHKLPKVGDLYFTGFQSDFDPDTSKTYKIAEIDEERPIYDDDHCIEGRTVYIEEEGSWFDCFWSTVYGIFLYAID